MQACRKLTGEIRGDSRNRGSAEPERPYDRGVAVVRAEDPILRAWIQRSWSLERPNGCGGPDDPDDCGGWSHGGWSCGGFHIRPNDILTAGGVLSVSVRE